ncbi:sensor domain-containing diguanylate cyclase [Clostridium sp. DL1XJH146]
MFRITRKVFVDLAICMIGFGILIGLLFPFFLLFAKIPSNIVFTPQFFLLCISAGLIVGTINIILARFIIGDRLKLLTNRMSSIEKSLKESTSINEILDNKLDSYFVEIYSEDELGITAKAFNNLVETLYVSLKREKDISKYTELLTSNLDIDTLSKEALLQLIAMSKAESGAILLESKCTLKLLNSIGMNNTKQILTNEFFLNIYKKNKHFNPHISNISLINTELEQFNLKELIIEPIEYKQKQIGAIILLTKGTFSKISKDSLHLYSQNLALALNNALIHNKYMQLASKDSLTKSFNRGFGMKLLTEEFVHAKKSEYPLIILMFDVDNFKNINDTYGHSVGDIVLCEISKIVYSVLREDDIFFRYGGEEFIAVLKNISIINSYKIAERIRTLIEEKSKNFCKRKITISIGISSLNDHNINSTQQLIVCADRALYYAKNSGRNKVVIYNESLPTLTS